MARDQHVVIVSGLSGAGKSTVLRALEDMGYYCVDNLPASLLHDFGPQIQAEPALYGRVALGIDARAPGLRLDEVPAWLESLRAGGLRCQLLYLTASDATLIKRFGETRRRHPLAEGEGALQVSIAKERELLEPVRRSADRELDTSDTNIHQLRHMTWQCVGPDVTGVTVVLQSFGFSNGVPTDADFVFDARSLPNPHWNMELRPLTGRDPEVARWLEQDDMVEALSGDVRCFLQKWLPELDKSLRSFITVAIGCTGGRHRSVYMVERLATELRGMFPDIMIHHRDLEN